MYKSNDCVEEKYISSKSAIGLINLVTGDGNRSRSLLYNWKQTEKIRYKKTTAGLFVNKDDLENKINAYNPTVKRGNTIEPKILSTEIESLSCVLGIPVDEIRLIAMDKGVKLMKRYLKGKIKL